jgi:hypothetical protein
MHSAALCQREVRRGMSGETEDHQMPCVTLPPRTTCAQQRLMNSAGRTLDTLCEGYVSCTTLKRRLIKCKDRIMSAGNRASGFEHMLDNESTIYACHGQSRKCKKKKINEVLATYSACRFRRTAIALPPYPLLLQWPRGA